MFKVLDKRVGSISISGHGHDGAVAVVGSNQNQSDAYFVRTRRSKCQVNVTLEDFTRIHTQFSERLTPSYIETQQYALADNERIKFQFRLKPGTHDLHFDAIYQGTEASASVLIEAYLLDRDGRKFPFDYSRKVDIQIGLRNVESLNNFLYDRDELERKRDRLFTTDRLTICFDVNVTWCEVSDKPAE
jgi:hypothetical protein